MFFPPSFFSAALVPSHLPLLEERGKKKKKKTRKKPCVRSGFQRITHQNICCYLLLEVPFCSGRAGAAICSGLRCRANLAQVWASLRAGEPRGSQRALLGHPASRAGAEILLSPPLHNILLCWVLIINTAIVAFAAAALHCWSLLCPQLVLAPASWPGQVAVRGWKWGFLGAFFHLAIRARSPGSSGFAKCRGPLRVLRVPNTLLVRRADGSALLGGCCLDK